VIRFDEIGGRLEEGRLLCEEAAHVLGMSVSSFYRWRRRYEAEGGEGLVDAMQTGLAPHEPLRS